MDNKITIYNQLGEAEEVEVLDIFQLEEYGDKEYILYTKNKEVDENNIEVFVSILEEKDEHFELKLIEDKEELDKVKQVVAELGEEVDE